MSYAPLLTETTLNSTATYTPTSPVTQKPNSRKIKRTSRSRTPKKPALSRNYPIIVHCHLCWDWVWQRPQQFLSRLSERHKILFVETIAPDPQLAAPLARFSKPEKFPNLTILRLQFPTWRWNDGEYVVDTIFCGRRIPDRHTRSPHSSCGQYVPWGHSQPGHMV